VARGFDKSTWGKGGGNIKAKKNKPIRGDCPSAKELTKKGKNGIRYRGWTRGGKMRPCKKEKWGEKKIHVTNRPRGKRPKNE